MLRAGGTPSTHPWRGTQQQICCRPALCRDKGGIEPRGGKRRVSCSSRQGKVRGRCRCCASHGAQSHGYELQGFGATSGAAESCPPRVPRGKSRAEAEGPRNLGSRTVPPEKPRPTTTTNFRPSAATPGSGPSLCLCTEEAPQLAGGPSAAHFWHKKDTTSSEEH